MEGELESQTEKVAVSRKKFGMNITKVNSGHVKDGRDAKK
jgi:hypothetical protein